MELGMIINTLLNSQLEDIFIILFRHLNEFIVIL